MTDTTNFRVANIQEGDDDCDNGVPEEEWWPFGTIVAWPAPFGSGLLVNSVWLLLLLWLLLFWMFGVGGGNGQRSSFRVMIRRMIVCNPTANTNATMIPMRLVTIDEEETESSFTSLLWWWWWLCFAVSNNISFPCSLVFIVEIIHSHTSVTTMRIWVVAVATVVVVGKSDRVWLWWGW